MSVDTILNVLFIINGLVTIYFFVQTESSVNINLLYRCSYYETTYCGFRDALSRWLSGVT